MECIVDTCLSVASFSTLGDLPSCPVTETAPSNDWFSLQGAPATYETTGVAFLAVWIFQSAFADTCSTITSGAMIGQTAWIGDLYTASCMRLTQSVCCEFRERMNLKVSICTNTAFWLTPSTEVYRRSDRLAAEN
jgi:hypothetical protein